MSLIKPKYHSTQPEFYSGCDTIADNLEVELLKFTAFKGKYVALYITNLRAKIAAARAFPNDAVRSAVAQELRVQMVAANDKCLVNFRYLERYIADIFPGADQSIQINAAGGGFYTTAANENWEDVVAMNTDAVAYIIANKIALLNGGLNMPVGFEAQCSGDADDFKLLYDSYKIATQTESGTDEKIEANNDLYDVVINICLDGQVIFIKDEAKAKKFTWSAILDIITPPGAASLTIEATNDATNEPEAGVSVSIQQEGKPAIAGTTDGEGKVVFKNIEQGSYRVVGTKLTFVTVNTTKQVDTGVNAKLEIRMVGV